MASSAVPAVPWTSRVLSPEIGRRQVLGHPGLGRARHAEQQQRPIGDQRGHRDLHEPARPDVLRGDLGAVAEQVGHHGVRGQPPPRRPGPVVGRGQQRQLLGVLVLGVRAQRVTRLLMPCRPEASRGGRSGSGPSSATGRTRDGAGRFLVELRRRGARGMAAYDGRHRQRRRPAQLGQLPGVPVGPRPAGDGLDHGDGQLVRPVPGVSAEQPVGQVVLAAQEVGGDPGQFRRRQQQVQIPSDRLAQAGRLVVRVVGDQRARPGRVLLGRSPPWPTRAAAASPSRARARGRGSRPARARGRWSSTASGAPATISSSSHAPIPAPRAGVAPTRRRGEGPGPGRPAVRPGGGRGRT